MDFQKHLEAEETKENKSEIDIYLSNGVERGATDDFDVLLWWKTNSIKFPILSFIAKYVLAMSIMTVGSESAFSTGGRVIDPFSSSLTPKTAEALICAQDWLRSKPADIETPLGVIEEIRQKLEEVELDEFSKGPKYLHQVIIEE
ncbi:zinc finger BED domain-containing protein RICESLEEPER 2-like [Apium graveolens]|uniref:zinc finger BED domain-containing protein RICESLEEPER 2-like n=1 Tax=Apium graveolens TaxID=4045 RepID=UPI003D79EB6D